MRRFMTKFRKKFRYGEKGFTLIELLIVVAILGILAAVVIPNVGTFLESGKVGAAGIDIIAGEWLEDITMHPLVQYAQKHDNLVITPHIGGATTESIGNARIFMAKKLAVYMRQRYGDG